MITQSKIDKAISLLQKAERIALKYSDKGFYLAFSGGKDSQCIYHLAKMAGVKFEAHYNMTTVDPPEVVHFIRDKYPEVIIDRPPATMWQIIEKHNMLPTKSIRYCCQELKESKGGGMVNIIGVRRAESTKRAKRNSVELNGRRFSGTIDQFNAALSGESVVSACMAKFNDKDKDKVMILPIIDWTDSDVWSFIKNYLKIPYCKLYDEGRTRIGCIICPMSTRGELARESKRYPKYVDAYRRVINRLIAKGYFKGFEDADDVLSWWSSKESVKKYFENKKQLKLF